MTGAERRAGAKRGKRMACGHMRSEAQTSSALAITYHLLQSWHILSNKLHLDLHNAASAIARDETRDETREESTSGANICIRIF